ncbi:MAG TPA: hypothetical protein VGK16_02950 [Candidatus Limnocylindrales bacterium]|jgi:hypothetical protein
MRTGSIGGALILACCASLLAAALVAAGGGTVGYGGAGDAPGSLLLDAAIVFGAAGAWILAIAAPPPLAGRAARLGLGLIATWLTMAFLTLLVSAGGGSDGLESIPVLVGLLVGGLAALVGVPLTAVALVRSAGPARLAGGMLLTGLVLVIAAAIATSSDFSTVATVTPTRSLALPMVVAGAVLLLLAVASVGVLAIRGEAPRGTLAA